MSLGQPATPVLPGLTERRVVRSCDLRVVEGFLPLNPTILQEPDPISLKLYNVNPKFESFAVGSHSQL